MKTATAATATKALLLTGIVICGLAVSFFIYGAIDRTHRVEGPFNSAARRLYVSVSALFAPRGESAEAARMIKLARASMPYIRVYDDSIYLFRAMKKGNEWWVVRRLNPDDPRACSIADGGETFRILNQDYNTSTPDGLIPGTSGDGGYGGNLEREGLLCPDEYRIYDENGRREICFYDPRPKPKCKETSTNKTPPENPADIRRIYAIALKSEPLLAADRTNFRVYIRRNAGGWFVMRHEKPFGTLGCNIIDGPDSFLLSISGGKITKKYVGETFDAFFYENYFTCPARPDLYDETGKRTQCLPSFEELFLKTKCGTHLRSRDSDAYESGEIREAIGSIPSKTDSADTTK